MCQDYADGRDAEAICRRTLATMFAHFTQETGGHNPNGEVAEWRQGLVYLREAGCSETGPGCGYDRSVIKHEYFLSKPVYCVSIHKSKE